MTTGTHEHCFCLQDTIGRPMCCKCWASLLPDGSITYPQEIIDGVKRGVQDVKEGKVTPWKDVKEKLNL